MYTRSKFRMNLCYKCKWFDWIDDNILCYIWDLPLQKIDSCRLWFKMNFNKYHFRLLKNVFFAYPFDYYYMLSAEEAMLDKCIYYFENNQIIEDTQYERLLRTIKWAKYCLHVVNNTSELYTYDNIKGYVYIGPYVNKRNAKRFYCKEQLKNDYLMSHDEELYLTKAERLYYKIREQYTDYWWD